MGTKLTPPTTKKNRLRGLPAILAPGKEVTEDDSFEVTTRW